MAMQFAIIMNGDNAPTPAPRIEAIPSVSGIGIYSELDGEIWQADMAAIMAALPFRYSRYATNGVWFDKKSRIDGAGDIKGDCPYFTLFNTRGNRKATGYLLPVKGI